MSRTELTKARKGLQASRTAIEKLLDTVDANDHFAMAKLGGILADLKTAQNELNQLNQGN